MAFEAVPLNESIPSPYLDKYEPTKGRKDYVFICTNQKWRTDLHYSDNLKTTFHCFNGSCCKVVPKKTPTTIYLIAQYVDYKDPESGLILKYLKAGRQLDEQIRAIADQFDDPSKLTKIDLVLTLDTSKSEKFKMVKVTPCVGGKRKACKTSLLDLKEQIKAYLPSLQQSVATILDENSFRALCEEHNIDVDEYTGDMEATTAPAEKPIKKVAKVEEPEDIEVEEPIDTEEADDIKEPETEEVKAPKKQSKDDIVETDFDIDDLL